MDNPNQGPRHPSRENLSDCRTALGRRGWQGASAIRTAETCPTVGQLWASPCRGRHSIRPAKTCPTVGQLWAAATETSTIRAAETCPTVQQVWDAGLGAAAQSERGNLSDSRTASLGRRDRGLHHPSRGNLSDCPTSVGRRDGSCRAIRARKPVGQSDSFFGPPRLRPPPPSRGNLSDSRTGLKVVAGRGLRHPSRGNLSDSRTALGHRGWPGPLLRPIRRNLSDCRTGLKAVAG
ncbi:hypothetical protein D7Y21_29600 [Corallococcus sp. AB045]|nr:hypothetical protein D7Y21_29600 [Corallococcus sp. AB045]